MCELLKKQEYNNVLTVLHLVDPTPDNRHRLKRMIETFTSSAQFEKSEIFRAWPANSTDAELVYYFKCLELLTLLAVGRDRSGTEHFVATQVPLRACLDQLHDALELALNTASADVECAAAMHAELLLRFLAETYYDTEVHDNVALHSARHRQALMRAINVLTHLTDSPRKHAHALRAELIEAFTCFFIHVPRAHAPHCMSLMSSQHLYDCGSEHYRLIRLSSVFQFVADSCADRFNASPQTVEA